VGYTVRDTPAVVARIESDLARVTETVQQADSGLQSLVLTGSFARGDGAVLDGVPQNDYDFVAFRGVARPRLGYAALRLHLEDRLGLHVDLAPVAAWRLRWVSPSIFWYETALRGRVLWGKDLLGRIPVRRAKDIDPAEGMRLLVNRAAGLLLATAEDDAQAMRLQAAKALLAAADAWLLARGGFSPGQVDRWQRLGTMRHGGPFPPELERLWPWLQWAYLFKVEPDAAPPRDAVQAWQAAARAVLDAVPTALASAGFPSLKAYARHDGIAGHLVYLRRSAEVEGARRLALHPTGTVRVATLRLLEASLDGQVRPEAARDCLRGVARVGSEPLRTLRTLRLATLQ
jgi:hypothetical protein